MAFEKFKTDNWEYNDEYLSEVFHKIVDAGAIRLAAKRKYKQLYNTKDERLAAIKRDVRNHLVEDGFQKPTVMQIDAACVEWPAFEEFHQKLLDAELEFEKADQDFWNLKLEWDTCSQIMKERGSEKIKTKEIW